MLGATSLVVWTLTLEVLIKYVGVVLRADDHGNGGWACGSGRCGGWASENTDLACGSSQDRAHSCPVHDATAVLTGYKLLKLHVLYSGTQEAPLRCTRCCAAACASARTTRGR